MSGTVCLSGLSTPPQFTVLRLTLTSFSMPVVEPNCPGLDWCWFGCLFLYWGLDYRASYGAVALLCPLTCYVMLCYVMLCYVMLCYVMLCYVMLCFNM